MRQMENENEWILFNSGVTIIKINEFSRVLKIFLFVILSKNVDILLCKQNDESMLL